MTTHDPMCIGITDDWRGNQPCDCERVRKIRADEQEKYKAWGPTVLSTPDQTPVIADLRDKVVGLPSQGSHWIYQQAITDVLALIEEAQR